MNKKTFARIVGLAILLFSFSASAQLRISEFLAANTRVLADENGAFEDWIEIQNTSSTNVDLLNWSLTDNKSNPDKWRFPSTNLAPNASIVVFASNKDRRTPGARLHTNFKLDAEGEYLALVSPQGIIATEFSPYPQQVSDVSYGFGPTTTNRTLLTSGAAVRALVPSTNNGGTLLEYTWTGDATNEPFSDSSWQAGLTGAGFTDGAGDVSPSDIGLNLGGLMLSNNASVFLRIPFQVNDPTNLSLLTLRLKFNDGFVAWINGVQVASANAALETLAWDSTATATNSATITNLIQIGNAGTLLREGTNILAFQGLNVTNDDPTFLIAPELDATTVPLDSSVATYFITPTPGVANVTGSTQLGPGITDVGHTPNVPQDNDAIVVTARVFQTLRPVGTVILRYRIMFGGEVSVNMFDDGAHGDGAAGDSVYGATIPAVVSTMGQMVRYYIIAQDTSFSGSRWPLYRDAAGSEQYLGTVIATNVVSKLPVFHLFIAPANQSAADSQTGTRASFYYDGEFYDNIGIEVRGNTSVNFTKKSHRLEFNKEHPLRHPGPGGRIRKTSLMAEFPDPSYLRQHLSFWLQSMAGVPAAFDYPVHVRLNGAFYQLAFHNDVLGEEQQERLGYDPEGSLYKAAGSVQTSHYSLGIFQKLLPKTNGLVYASTADFDSMAAAISSTVATGIRKTNMFDILNLPEIINYMAVARFCQEGDDVWANMTVHRDTYGNQEWSIVPFDLNMSWGQLYYSEHPSVYYRVHATEDYYKSHPLYGGSQIQESGTSRPFNRLYDAIITVPETRQMLLRRMRTLMDTLFQASDTPYGQDLILQHINTMTNLIWEEAKLDRQKWGWPPIGGFYGFGSNLWLTNGVQTLISQFLMPRRDHFFFTHCVVNTSVPVGVAPYLNAGIPTQQPENAVVSIRAFDYNPASGNQDQEYVSLTNANSFAVDISGWKLQGAIDFTFTPGTVMAANSALFVSPNVRAFRSRTVTPRGGQGWFVQGNYSGHLSAWGESLTLTDTAGRLVSSNGFAGTPSTAQRYLRITEIMYNPSPALTITNDEQQFEYIELKNISTNLTIDLTGVRFTNGIYFNFTGSAVTSLAAQQTVLLVRNLTAFTNRYGTGFSIAGEFTGLLDNGSEELRLEDPMGEKILEFDYEDDWYPITDGLGFSLVIVDENAHWSTWGDEASWRPSGLLNGSPGTSDPAPPAFAPILVNEALTHTDPPLLDSVELFNPTTNTVNIGGWFLTDDFNSPQKYRISSGTTIPPHSYVVFNENQFTAGTNGFRFNELGEGIYLFSADNTTNLTGYFHGHEFGEAPNGVSFGRYTNSQTNTFFVLQSSRTLGTNNAYPRVGPIVISEIMYRPPDINGADNDLDEFIELQNISATAVPLYDPGAATNTWRLRNAVDFDFPPAQSLLAGARLLVVGFNPTNTAQVSAFRSKFDISNTVPVFGPWSGKLDNSGDTIELKQPDSPNGTTNVIVPYIMIDKVAYRDSAPWAAGADGVGNSLQRLSGTGFGNDPTNWFAAGITAGRTNLPNVAPVISILTPTNNSIFPYGIAPQFTVSVSDPGGSIASVRYMEGEIVVATVTNTPFEFTWQQPAAGPHTIRAIATDDLGGIAVSEPVKITVANPSVMSFASQYSFVSEGQSGSSTMTVNVTLSPPSVLPATARLSTSNMTAIAGTDYIATNGVLTFAPGETSKQISVRVQGDTELEYDEYFTVHLSSPTNCILGSNSTYGIVINDDWSPIDYLTEEFDWNSTNDLSFRSFTFTPDGSTNFYSVCQQPITSFPSDPAGGTTVSLTDDSFVQVTLPTNEKVSLYGKSTNVFFIGSNGYLTFGSGSTSLGGDLSSHFSLRRVSALFDDLNPGSGGSVSWKRFTNRVAVTFSAVPEFGSTTFPNTFQIEMFFDGRIRLNYLKVSISDGLAGLSDGQGMPPGLVESDFSSYGICLQPPVIQLQPQSSTRPAETNVTFTVSAVGYPAPAYQWFFNSNSIVGATQPSLTLSNIDLLHAGAYYAVATNIAGSATSIVAHLTVFLPDSDGDGLTDRWERANGTDPAIADATTDLDGDGLSNIQEFLAGTSPTNAASVLRIELLPLNGAEFVFSFTAVSNHTYSIQSQGSLSSSWRKVRDITSVPTNRIVWQTNSAAGTNHYFRIVTPLLEPADSDGDELPDAWEEVNGTDMLKPDSGEDPDSDRLNNLQEYLAGTVPTNALSALRIENVMVLETNLVFSFNAVSNRTYAAQLKTGGAPWNTVQEISALPVDRTVWLTNGIESTGCLFRITLTPQP